MTCILYSNAEVPIKDDMYTMQEYRYHIAYDAGFSRVLLCSLAPRTVISLFKVNMVNSIDSQQLEKFAHSIRSRRTTNFFKRDSPNVSPLAIVILADNSCKAMHPNVANVTAQSNVSP